MNVYHIILFYLIGGDNNCKGIKGLSGSYTRWLAKTLL